MLDFFKKLLPNLEKRKMIGQVENVKQGVNDVLFQTTAAVIATRFELGNKPTVSTLGKQFERDAVRRFGRKLHHNETSNYAVIVESVAKRLDSKLLILRRYIDELFSNNVATSGLTFKQVEVMRLVDLGQFFVKYSMKLIHQVNWEECKANGIDLDKVLLPGEVKWLQENYQSYLSLCEIFSLPDNEFSTTINRTSDLVISEVEQDVGVLGVTTDPLRLGFMPIVGDVIFFIRSLGLEAENKAYERNKLRLQSIQLQLQALQQKQKEGVENESLKRQIDYYSERIQSLENEIRKYEEKAGV